MSKASAVAGWKKDHLDAGSPYRAITARALMDRIPTGACKSAQYVVDIGCGTGTFTWQLARLCPLAKVLGIDQAANLIGAAKAAARDPVPNRVSFAQADACDWTPDRPVDIFYSHSSLHWIPDHDRFLARIALLLNSDGIIAVSMPVPFRTPLTDALEKACADPRWKAKLIGQGLQPDAILPVAVYGEIASRAGLQMIDAGDEPFKYSLTASELSQWVRASLLRPFLNVLDPADESARFLKVFEAEVCNAYGCAPGENLSLTLPTRFFVAQRT
jgi:trans-aconitate 2-methyltransferase